ncbi:NAD(P)-binding protein [Streptomyces sp. NPDC013433]|uniref:NAD(P)-binding protein n=1 Tax=Streptomyces sp. NPDC013433 TaxID=3155604 RepID=UPI003456CF50
MVGCGMAGCAAAWWLEHEGWEVVLVDKDPSGLRPEASEPPRCARWLRSRSA